jgi:hypothetical protein
LSPDCIYPLKPTRNQRWPQDAKLKNHHAFLSLLSAMMRLHDRPKFCQSIRGGNTNAYMDTIDLQNGFADIMIPLGDQASMALHGGHHDRLLTPGDYCRHRLPAPRCPGCPATPAFFTSIVDWKEYIHIPRGASRIGT